ncbi:MAG: hypothetical protein K8J09_19725, partial [Planctomycetes bacterium]|nr:hypothetical protein [Planctomycetota bacterium]
SDAATSLKAAMAARQFGVRAEDLLVAGGHLRLLVSLRNLGLGFTSEEGVPPPSVHYLTESGDRVAPVWQAEEHGRLRCSWRHDLLRASAMIEVGDRARFRVRVLGGEEWRGA